MLQKAGLVTEHIEAHQLQVEIHKDHVLLKKKRKNVSQTGAARNLFRKFRVAATAFSAILGLPCFVRYCTPFTMSSCPSTHDSNSIVPSAQHRSNAYERGEGRFGK